MLANSPSLLDLPLEEATEYEAFPDLHLIPAIHSSEKPCSFARCCKVTCQAKFTQASLFHTCVQESSEEESSEEDEAPAAKAAAPKANGAAPMEEDDSSSEEEEVSAPPPPPHHRH